MSLRIPQVQNAIYKAYNVRTKTFLKDTYSVDDLAGSIFDGWTIFLPILSQTNDQHNLVLGGSILSWKDHSYIVMWDEFSLSWYGHQTTEGSGHLRAELFPETSVVGNVYIP